MDKELYDKLVELVIYVKKECLLDDDGKNPLVWANNEGVTEMSRKMQKELFYLFWTSKEREKA